MTEKLTANQWAFRSLVDTYGKAELARAAGISRQSVQNWSTIPVERAVKIATALDLPVSHVRPEPYAVP